MEQTWSQSLFWRSAPGNQVSCLCQRRFPPRLLWKPRPRRRSSCLYWTTSLLAHTGVTTMLATRDWMVHQASWLWCQGTLKMELYRSAWKFSLPSMAPGYKHIKCMHVCRSNGTLAASAHQWNQQHQRNQQHHHINSISNSESAATVHFPPSSWPCM